jgi:hypothetical protein
MNCLRNGAAGLFRRMFAGAITAALLSMPAQAATTVYASSIFSQSGVSAASEALFSANGSAALISSGGELVLQYNNPLTGSGVGFSLLPFAGPAANFVAVSVGEVIGGIATFSAGSIAFADFGAGGAGNFDLSALCATVSATGCSLLRIQNIASFGTAGVFIDGVSGVSNAPEPSVWLMMIVGFAGVAWRLKSGRKKSSKSEIQHAFA